MVVVVVVVAEKDESEKVALVLLAVLVIGLFCVVVLRATTVLGLWRVTRPLRAANHPRYHQKKIAKTMTEEEDGEVGAAAIH